MEKARSRNHYSLTFGVVLLLVYSVTVPFTTNLGSLNILPTMIIAWIPMMLAVVVAYILVQVRKRIEGI